MYDRVENTVSLCAEAIIVVQVIYCSMFAGIGTANFLQVRWACFAAPSTVLQLQLYLHCDVLHYNI